MQTLRGTLCPSLARERGAPIGLCQGATFPPRPSILDAAAALEEMQDARVAFDPPRSTRNVMRDLLQTEITAQASLRPDAPAALLGVPPVVFCEPTGPDSPFPALQLANRPKHNGTHTQKRTLGIYRPVSDPLTSNHQIEPQQTFLPCIPEPTDTHCVTAVVRTQIFSQGDREIGRASRLNLGVRDDRHRTETA